ncbi:hypothetical protein JTE90_028452 [Oedothorax gibbosus]|uniref:Uncharacterized protein n=1 Tax=Oedothorax gibbosus TaxID=931172 RepID=A0AAV6VH61_9ARAC|nr:hypothetical protein JTE90_028452 [Oedothorax gibbosus]
MVHKLQNLLPKPPKRSGRSAGPCLEAIDQKPYPTTTTTAVYFSAKAENNKFLLTPVNNYSNVETGSLDCSGRM